MGRNTPLGTQVVNMSKWDSHQPFREQVKVVKKRGPKKGSYQRPDFTTDPRTPFEALRCLLKISRPEWEKLLGVSQAGIGSFERGEMIASVPLAKRMIEEARVRGIAVTLDKLYQHVVMWEKLQMMIMMICWTNKIRK